MMDRAGIAERNEILRGVIGSGAHGVAIDGQDDHDEMGVFIEPPDLVLGLAGQLDSHVWRTQPEGHRSGAGDIDRVRYSLRHYLALATKGNPSVLVLLYTPQRNASELGMELLELTPAIVSQQAGRRFLGYLHGQLERLEGGGKQNRLPKRPELVRAHGYDTKYASHALRLGIQGLDLLLYGRLWLPMREPNLSRVRAVKLGEVPLPEVLEQIHRVRDRLADAVADEGGPLPRWPDLDRVTTWMISAHLAHWQHRRLV